MRNGSPPWAELLRRVFGTEALVCPDCRGPRRLLAFHTDPPVVRKILAHLGIATEPPALARAKTTADAARDPVPWRRG